MADLTLRGVTKSYGTVPVIHGVDLEVRSGEFVVFVGPSGCGKSTLLRMIAGLESISGGTIAIGGEVVNDMAPARRGVAMVFQSYALYPHMTVRGNMAFGLEVAGLPRAEIARRVERAARMLRIEALLDRKPRALSGGQRQRVAIGRAITRDPRLFLFDEPLSNLDAALRVATRVEIARLKAEMPATTMIYVTHDQVEAMTLSDRIVVMNAGRVEQVGTPLELYRAPANTFVAGFIGSPGMNLLDAGPLGVGGAATVGVRPEDLRLAAAGEGLVEGTVTLDERLGDVTVAHVDVGGATVVAKLAGDAPLQRGDRVALAAGDRALHRFDAAGRRLRP